VASPGPLNGTDPEDGALGSTKLFNVVVGAGMNGNKLFYNGVEITGGFSIVNYNPALLSVQFTGAGSTSLSFIYQSFDGANAGSNFATYTINWLSALTARLFTATAALNGTTATISWKTDNEVNTSRFYTERSTDNKNFTAVNNIPAAGNSTTIKNYSCTDDITLLNSSVVYYRIKLVDLDGRITYSNTVVVRMPGIDAVKIWPSPFENSINATLYSKINTQAQLTITDAAGKRVVAESYTITKGNNQLNINSLGQLAKGIYTLQLIDKTGSIQFAQKIIKQ
jgi:Secretion system C-terminal sorting domain